MSLVGPRPPLPDEVAQYELSDLRKLSMPQGITGLWQVSGRKSLSFEDMVRLDIEYTQRQSLALDARILLQTVGTVLSRDGS